MGGGGGRLLSPPLRLLEVNCLETVLCLFGIFCAGFGRCFGWLSHSEPGMPGRFAVLALPSACLRHRLCQEPSVDIEKLVAVLVQMLPPCCPPCLRTVRLPNCTSVACN